MAVPRSLLVLSLNIVLGFVHHESADKFWETRPSTVKIPHPETQCLNQPRPLQLDRGVSLRNIEIISYLICVVKNKENIETKRYYCGC